MQARIAENSAPAVRTRSGMLVEALLSSFMRARVAHNIGRRRVGRGPATNEHGSRPVFLPM
jgi:hypothetical protein